MDSHRKCVSVGPRVTEMGAGWSAPLKRRGGHPSPSRSKAWQVPPGGLALANLSVVVQQPVAGHPGHVSNPIPSCIFLNGALTETLSLTNRVVALQASAKVNKIFRLVHGLRDITQEFFLHFSLTPPGLTGIASTSFVRSLRSSLGFGSQRLKPRAVHPVVRTRGVIALILSGSPRPCRGSGRARRTGRRAGSDRLASVAFQPA